MCKQKTLKQTAAMEREKVSGHTILHRPLVSISSQSFGVLLESHSFHNMPNLQIRKKNNNKITENKVESKINEYDAVFQLQPGV